MFLFFDVDNITMLTLFDASVCIQYNYEYVHIIIKVYSNDAYPNNNHNYQSFFKHNIQYY